MIHPAWPDYRQGWRKRLNKALHKRGQHISRKRLRKMSRQHDCIKTYYLDLRQVLIANSLKDARAEQQYGTI